MRSTKSIILIVIALGCGLIASIGISQVMEKRSGSSSPVETVSIYVAAANVPQYEKLSGQLVRVEEWPKDKVPAGTATKMEQLDGKRPKVPLFPGEPIMLTKLADENSGSAFSDRIPEGMQVFAVKVDQESSLAGIVLPGDRVDVLVFMRGRSDSENIRTGVRTILKNVSVFAVNDQIGRNTEEEGASIDAKTVSLLVKPEQSERLLLAKQLGTLHLALRKPGDETTSDSKGATPSDLDESDEGAEWSKGIAKSESQKPAGGIIDILDNMKAMTSKAVDTSSSLPVVAAHEMVIMSPSGVLSNYHFNGGNTLPDELRGVGGAPAGTTPPSGGPSVPASAQGANAGADATASGDGKSDTSTADSADVDPALLGL